MTNTAQLAVFVHGVKKDIHVVEDFVQLIAMVVTTTGAHILKTLLQCLKTMNKNLSKLVQ